MAFIVDVRCQETGVESTYIGLPNNLKRPRILCTVNEKILVKAALDTDRHWKAFGDIDPYFGVISDPKYRGKLADEAVRADFFSHGAEYVQNLVDVIKSFWGPDFAPRRALDFGCGVGRLTIPFAKFSGQVVGMDISEAMIKEGQKNCELAGVANVTMVKSDDSVSKLVEPFDFIHSFIVFQHIPVDRGEAIFSGLLAKLSIGGIGALHFTFDSGLRGFRRSFSNFRKAIPIAHYAANLARGRPLSYPHMQMNEYDFSRLLGILEDNGCHDVRLRFSNHGGSRGAMVFFRKLALPLM